jgi:signal transduction histidine kinase/ligand-binding sensor domain-containing protein
LLVFAALHPCQAVDSSLRLTQFVHTRWTQADEPYLSNVRALAQTDDGFLWIGTPKGLLRFDGVRFVRWWTRQGEPLSGIISSLLAAPNGVLWVGTYTGLVRLERGRLTKFASGGMIQGAVAALGEDGSRGLWIGSSLSPHSSGLAHWNGARLDDFGRADGLPQSFIAALLVDGAGNLWLGANASGLYRKSPGEPGFTRELAGENVQSMAMDSDGSLVIVFGRKLLRLRNGVFELAVPTLSHLNLGPIRVYSDRDRNLWLATYNKGIIRLGKDSTESFTDKDGLSDSAATAVFEDREGDLWVGTISGLDRFRQTRLTRVSKPEGLSEEHVAVVTASHDGSIWAGTATRGLNRITGTTALVRQRPETLANHSIYSLFPDASGRIWVGTNHDFGVIQEKNFLPIRMSNGASLDKVMCVASDGTGTMWVSDGARGLVRISRNSVEPLRVNGLPRASDDPVYALLHDSRGRLWIGYDHSGLFVLEGDSVRRWNGAEGPSGGAVISFYEDRAGAVWVGTADGLSRLRAGHWTVWGAAQGYPTAVVQSIIEDDVGGYWLTTQQGLERIDGLELARQADGAPRPFHFSLYGVSEAFRPPTSAVFKPLAAKSAGGRLWFATAAGIVWIDPSKRAIAAQPSRPEIEQVRIDGQSQPLDSPSLVSGFRARTLELDYTAPSLRASDDVVFRYRLVGLDRDWTDAGTRRQAYYTNLPPRRYQFQVAAAHKDGPWDAPPVTFQFEILPAFYQTNWFLALCVLTGATLLFGIYRLRLARITQRLEAQLAERTRIARELHDNLLQSVVGISLQLDGIANRLSATATKEHADLMRVRRQVDQALRETRQSVWACRTGEPAAQGLVQSLKETAASLTAGHPMTFGLNVTGTPNALPAEVGEHLLQIAREAIRNAVHHSGGGAIEIELAYQHHGVCLRVSDDGAGMALELLDTGRPGHFGLRGMRERSEQIGGRFRVHSRPGRGVSVEVTLNNAGIAHPREQTGS